MNKICWIAFTVLVVTAEAYWDEDYDQPWRHNYHNSESGHGGYHNYHYPNNYHGYKHQDTGYHYPSPSTGWGHGPDHDQWKNRASWNWDNEDNRQESSWSPRISYPVYNFEGCLKNCRTTSEFSPVCGTDGITYLNPSGVQCARACGKNVNIAGPYPCSSGSMTTSNPISIYTPASTLSSQETMRNCIRTCPTTSEYNPVCGTNGVTYTNPSRLECAQKCGVDVKFLQKYRCPAFGELPSNPTNPTSPPAITLTPTPSLPTPSATPPATPSATPPPNPPPSPPTVPSILDVTPTEGQSNSDSTPPASNGIDTIPKEILDMIFTTTEPVFSIDERFEAV